MRRRGVCYDVGRVLMGQNWRPMLDAGEVHRELEIIRDDLHCNAVRICGQDLDRLVTAGQDALDQGLEVWLSPELWDHSPTDTLDYVAEAAKRAEELRRHWPGRVVFSVGSELTLFMRGMLEGDTFLERLHHPPHQAPGLHIRGRLTRRRAAADAAGRDPRGDARAGRRGRAPGRPLRGPRAHGRGPARAGAADRHLRRPAGGASSAGRDRGGRTRRAADTGCRFHVVHVSAAQTVALLRDARARGVPISGETCPQYLLLTDADHERLGPRMKVYPPIRTAADQAALWAGLNDGTLVSVGSDHAPHTVEEQERPLATRPAGILGVEALVPLMLDAMHRGRLAPARVAAVLAEDTARLYGIDHSKGLIRIGNDADFTLVDPARPFTIDTAAWHSLNPSSVWHGRRGHGVPVASVLRGALAMRDGEPVGPPRGALVRWETTHRSRPSGQGKRNE